MVWKKCERFLRAFFSSEYKPDSDGIVRPVRPDFCPSSSGGEPGVCKLRCSEWRYRKCGPGHRLLVLRCVTHRTTFTIYPDGWVPFGRQALVRTIEAVDDKVGGKSWPETATGSRPTRRTQVRWIHAHGVLLGTDPSFDDSDVHEISLTIGVSALNLLECRRARDGPPTPKCRAEAIRIVLTLISDRKSLLRSGVRAKYWGPPTRTF